MNINGISSGRRGVSREDPWPQMEQQVEAIVNGLAVQIQRFREVSHSTVTAEDELIESINAANEAVEDMRFALDTAMEHPELFVVTTEELQERAEKTRSWEREMVKAMSLGDKIKRDQRQRAAQERGASAQMDAFSGENNDFLRQEHEAQQRQMQVDETTLDRLSGGVRRVKETAVHIDDELNTQMHILDSIDNGVTRAQIRLDGAMKKIGKLLDSASDSKKMMCIVVLVVILVLLIMFVVK